MLRVPQPLFNALRKDKKLTIPLITYIFMETVKTRQLSNSIFFLVITKTNYAPNHQYQNNSNPKEYFKSFSDIIPVLKLRRGSDWIIDIGTDFDLMLTSRARSPCRLRINVTKPNSNFIAHIY